MKSKRITALCLILLSAILMLSSCTLLLHEALKYSNSGINNFKISDSSHFLTKYLIPEGFLEQYPYESGDYAFQEYGIHPVLWETAIIFMNYDEEGYSEAKAYAMQHMGSTEETKVQYNGYCLFERKLDNQNMRVIWGYCDEQRIIVSFGTVESAGTKNYVRRDLIEHLKTYFPFYNFAEGRIEWEKNITSADSAADTTAPVPSNVTVPIPTSAIQP